MPTSEEEPTTTPINYFGEESPGKGFEAGIEDEKMKILRLIATHGSTGQRMYDEAAQRAGRTQSEAKGEAVKGSMDVPMSTIRAVEADFDTRLRVFNDILNQDAQAAREDNLRRRSIEAIYKDSVSGDSSLEAEAQEGIDAFHEAMAEAAAARRGSGGGGGGGGRRSGGGGNGVTQPKTVVLGSLYDPDGDGTPADAIPVPEGGNPQRSTGQSGSWYVPEKKKNTGGGHPTAGSSGGSAGGPW